MVIPDLTFRAGLDRRNRMLSGKGYKTILITGGASGIGRLLALRFADQGHTVIVWDINEMLLSELTELASQEQIRITGMFCDVTDREMVYAKAHEVEAASGPLDILINNAGIVSGKPFLHTSDEQIEATVKVNLLSLLWVTRAFLPSMAKKRSGHVVTIASAAGLIGVRGLVDYSATKFAAVGFSESIRMELGGSKGGIRTTTVCPFFIDTGMFSGVKTRFPLLLPILKPEYVADRIVRGVLKEKKMIILPFFVRTLFLLRLFPVSLFDRVAEFFGINSSMDEFTGRTSHTAPDRQNRIPHETAGEVIEETIS